MAKTIFDEDIRIQKAGLHSMRRTVRAVLQQQNIYGDYDVDGITSITLIYTFLRDLGLDMVYYLPDRIEEGYGLNTEALKKLKDDGVSLVITVDCGISAVNEVEYAKSIGLDVCITDHHECSDTLPKAISIVNPKRPDSTYPFNSLAGVGVTFKVLSAIVKRLGLDENEYLNYIKTWLFIIEKATQNKLKD